MERSVYSKQGWVGVSLFLLFCAVGHSTKAQPLFTDINANLDPAFGSAAIGDAVWGDYDNDGDLDLAYTGAGANNTKVTRLYRNDDGTLVRVNAGLPNVSNGGLAWGDYDNDRDLDLFLMGADAQFVSISDVYRNDGNDTFTALGLGLPRVNGTVSWADFDNDGDLDVFLAAPLLYRNNGDDTFTQMNINLTQVFGGDAAWGDYDHDGDLDLVVVGLSGGSGTATVYRNEGAGSGANDWTFTDVNAGLMGVRDASVAWGDYNNNGYLDLAITGLGASANVSQIYHNNRNHTFSALGAGLEGVRWGDIEWGDFDGDGDPDVTLTGRTNSFINIVKIYENDNGLFSDTNIPLGGLFTSSVSWGDFDFDGDLDLFTMGSPDGATASAQIFRNNSGTANNSPTTPSNLNSGINGAALTLVWDQASDPQTTPANGLTYNIRLGTTPGGSEVVAPMSLASGRRQLAQMGNVQHNRLWTIENIDTTRTYYWTVQTVDNGFLGSPFAPEQIVQPKLITDSSFVEVDFGLQGLAASDAEWGDIDGDGDLDFAVTGGAGNQGFTYVYRNTNIGGLRSFQQVGGNLLAVHSGALSWADFDNDNDLDLLVNGLNSSLQAQTGLFENDGAGSFTAVNATLPNVRAGAADWADVDHDGDLDLLLTGSTSTGFISEIYENVNRNGLFLGMQAALTGLAGGDALFFDFNNDQKLEILATGQTEGGSRFTGLYEKLASGYTNTNPSIPGLWFSAVDVGDYDNDGDLDFAVSGARAEEDPTPQEARPFTAIYRNDISTGGGINQVSENLLQLYRCDMDWGDFDADGDLDLFITGFDGLLHHTRIYRNDGNDDVQALEPDIDPIISGDVEWGDYNNDGRLDILLTGQTSATLPVTRIYRNIRQESNNTPSPPTSGFSANVQGNRVTLSWGQGTDPQTPADGLTYNLRAGTTPGGNDVVSSSTGVLGLNKLARRGNTEQNRVWTIENVPANQTIYWSVQAVDNNFTSSAFSAEQSFESTNELLFTDTQMQIPGLRGGDAEWGDYDADGDLDLIILGRDASFQAQTILYRNDNGSFTEVNSGLPDVMDGAVAWGDVDGDGDLDLALSGRFSDGSRHTAVWLNADGTFGRMPNTVLTAVYYSDVAWGDLEQDGDLDLIVAGLIQEGLGPEDDQVLTEFYRNEVGKRLVKTETRVANDPTVGLANSYRGQLALTDFNQDSKLDLFISGKGEAILSLRALIYRNRSSVRPADQSIFSPVLRFINYDVPTGLIGVNFSSAAWGDYDDDGFPDLLYNGSALGSVPITKLYRNDNGQSFTEINAGLPQLWNGDLAWGDLDNDGDLDILLTGLDTNNNLNTFIRTNAQEGFSETITNLPAVNASAIALGDYDNDGDLDVVLTGNSTDGLISRIYRNESATANVPPTTPTGLTSNVNGDLFTLSWDLASDPEGGTVTYNVAIGTAANPLEVAPPHSLSDGFRQVPLFGNVGSQTSITMKLDTASAYHWSVQAVDNGFAGSAFSPTASSGQPDSLSFFNIMPDIDADLNFNFDWVDFDCDGDLDLFTDSFQRVYRNDGNGVFTRMAVGPDLYARRTDWGDVDNDGDPDVLFWGKTHVNADTGFVTLYQNDNGIFSEMERFFDNTDGFGFRAAVDLTDVDNDGWQDVYYFVEDLHDVEIAMLLRNAGDGTFEPVSAALPSDEVRTTSWVDYDGDGDLDHLALERGSNSIFRNDGNLTFTSVPLSLGRILAFGNWLDYDADGDLDLLATNSLTSVLYRHDLIPSGVPNFVEVSSATRIGFEAEVMEFNNDANMDLIADAVVFTVSANGAIRKAGLRLLSEASVISTAWGDYDNDHDLDVALYDSEVKWLRVYRNDAPGTPNVPPAAPDNLTASVSGNYVTLSWNAATDDVTPSQTLTYNLRIGSAPGLADVVAPLSVNTGSRKIVGMGNANLTRSWTYELAPNTTYYWSVQALDQSSVGGPFAPEQSFTTGSQSTLVRFVNLSADPSLNPLDIFLGGVGSNGLAKTSQLVVNDSPILDDLSYLDGSVLLPIPADSAISLLIAPGNSTGSADAVAQFDGMRFGAGQTHVISISGLVEPADFAANPEGRDIALSLHVQHVSRDSVELDTNEVAIYFVHGVTDAPAVAVAVVSADAAPVQLGTFSYGEASDIIPLTAGETEISITEPITNQRLVGFLRNLRGFAGSVVPVLFSGFIDPAANQNGPGIAIAPIAANGDVITFIEHDDPSRVPEHFQLFQNYPNPFNPNTTIRYSLPQTSQVELMVFDVLGRQVATLLNTEQVAGTHRVVFDASGLATGVYFYRLRAEDFVQTRKMLLLR